MIYPFLSSTNFLLQCQHNISFLNQNGWIGICMLVIIASMMLGAVAYGLSGLFPASLREKMKGAARYEYVQGVFSIILVLVIFGMSLSACDLGGALTSGATGYTDPFQFSQYYIGNLLFSKGIALTTGLFTAGTVLAIDAAIVNYVASAIGNLIPQGAPVNSGLGISVVKAIGITGTDEPASIIYEYSYVLNALLAPVIVVTFGLLFVIFLTLPAIEALALTLVIPIAIAMRSLAFAGPRLRDASNTFIALAIAFYFVLPLTIAMNYYIVNWVYCLNGGSCNPYVAYLETGGYLLNTLPVNQLLANPGLVTTANMPGTGTLMIPWNFFGYGAIAGSGGFVNMMKEVIQGIISVPTFLNTFGIEAAQYLFQGIFLIALDVSITVGFAVGLNKGLNMIGQLLAVGPFW